MTELLDRHLGQYHLTEIIRRGGMSTVYKAYQETLDRYVAVKVLFSNRDPQFAARFKREARAMAALQHHNILPIYDVGEQDGLLYLALQYVEKGVTLGDMLGKPMASPTALRLTAHVLDALDYAHKRGVIHRDIKPANVLMPSPNWPMLADFGIAKLVNDNQQRLTLANQIIGTAAYMAPEQATGRPIDARTDLYAIGVMLYELVTGRVPFDADTPMTVLTKHVYEAPPPARSLNPDLAPQVEQVLQRALAKDPGARYQSAAEMAEELNRVAAQIDQNKSRTQATGLYEIGVQAFEEGRWDVAVERLGEVVEIDPEYEDANELLAAAREAQERIKTEARQQIEMVRQRRQSTIQPQVQTPTEPKPALPSVLATTKLPALDEAALAGSTEILKQTTPSPAARAQVDTPAASALSAPDTAEQQAPPIPLIRNTSQLQAARPADDRPPTATAAPLQTATAQPAPAPLAEEAAQPAGRRTPLPWIIGAAVVALVAVVLLIVRPWQGTGPTAESPSPAPTAGAGGVGGVATAAPAAATPTTAPEPTTGAAPTAAPPAAAPPEPTGALVYQDDFSAGAAQSGLEDQTKSTDFQRGFHAPGVYHFKVLQPNDTRWEVLPRRAYTNFSLQIALNDNSDAFNGDVAQGMIFRVRDNSHFYAVLIDPRKGEYSVRKQDGADNWTDLIATKPSPLIKQQADVNLLRLDGIGDTFNIYLNGAALDSFKDGSYTFGMLGMIVANVDATEPHMHFDNIKVWTDDAPVAAGLPTERKDPKGDMVLIAGGPFILGSNEKRDEPAQIVALPNFYIDRAEVTNALYAQCVAEGKCTPPQSPASETHATYASDPQYANYPVIQVSWEQANTYCGWAGKRLPTEAEWEKAASWSPTTYAKSVWPWGDAFDPKQLNSAEGNAGDTTAVGTYPPELNGTVDMAANVYEWTSSLFKPYPYDEADGREDLAAGGDRVFRGGSWAQSQGKARTFSRQPAAANYFDREIGFRCALTP